MPITGFEDLAKALTGMIGGLDDAGAQVVKRSQVVFQREVVRSFTEQHARGTPTPAPPGNPPAVVTGTLRRSFVASEPERSGFGWSGQVYPTEVYARIQELGGVAGYAHLPARPYMAPSLRIVKPLIEGIHVEEYGKALKLH